MATTKKNKPHPLWDHQERALARCEQYLAKRRPNVSALITLPTGTGKTAIIAAVGARAAERSITLVVSPSDALCAQLVDHVGKEVWESVDLAKYGPPPTTRRLMPSDTVQMLQRRPDERLVLVATMQAIATIHRQAALLYEGLSRQTGLILVDEGHREPAPTWARALRTLEKPMILFSATPYRNDLRQFNVHSDFTEQLPFHKAVEARVIREVTVSDPIESGSAARFAASVVATIRELEAAGRLHENWKAIVRCEDAGSVNRLHDALMREPWAAERGVRSYHDTFPSSGVKASKVGKVAEDRERFLVHQSKLMEGIDDPSVQVLAIYQPFTNARALVQQVGRIVRNPGRGTKRAYLLHGDDDKLTPKQWLSFRAFDRSLGSDPLTDRDIVTRLLSALPHFDYVLGAFRKRVPEDFDLPFVDEVVVRRSALVFEQRNTAEAEALERVLPAIRESLISADRWIAKDVPDDAEASTGRGHIFVTAIVSPSKLLTESAFVELKFAVTVVRQVEHVLFLFDSEGLAFVDLEDLASGIKAIDLRPMLTGRRSRLTAITALNSDIGPRAIRARASSSYNLAESAPYLADHQFVLRRVQGYVDGKPRAVSVLRGRLTAGRAELVSTNAFAAWTREVVDELKRKRRNPIPPYLQRFSHPIKAPDPEGATPLHILLDAEALLDHYVHPDHRREDWTSGAELACEVVEAPEEDRPHGAEHCFNLVVFKEKRMVHIRYVPKRQRYELFSKFLDAIFNSNRPQESLLSALNAKQAFRIIPDEADTIYVGRGFYKVDLDVRAGGQGRLLLDLLHPVPQLEKLTSEKGDFSKAAAGKFAPESVFAFLDDALQGKLGSVLTDRSFDLIACTDLGREIADFVAVDTVTDRMVFVHAKAGEKTFSVSALQEVVGQAVKNLTNVTARSNRLLKELAVLEKPWCPKAGHTRERVRLGTLEEFLEEAARVSAAPNGQREVWLVLGHLLSKSAAEKKIASGTAEPAVLQMFMLLSALYTQCVSSGAMLRIFCHP